MSTTRTFVGIALFCLSAHLKASEAFEPIKEEPQCSCFMNGSDQKAGHKTAREIYEEAWRRNFDERWVEAAEASECAGLLDHGSTHWNFESF